MKWGDFWRRKDEMEKGKLLIGFWKELQSGTLNEGEWVVLLTRAIFFLKKRSEGQHDI